MICARTVGGPARARSHPSVTQIQFHPYLLGYVHVPNMLRGRGRFRSPLGRKASIVNLRNKTGRAPRQINLRPAIAPSDVL